MSNKLNVISNMENIRESEYLNIIGFIRLPTVEETRFMTLEEMFNNYDIKDINMNKDKEIPNLLNSQDKILFYSFKNREYEDYENILNSIIPSFEQIIQYYENKIIVNDNSYITELLSNFDINYPIKNNYQNELVIDVHHKYIDYYKNIIGDIQKEYDNTLKNKKDKTLKNQRRMKVKIKM